jgi:hypothetical protein
VLHRALRHFDVVLCFVRGAFCGLQGGDVRGACDSLLPLEKKARMVCQFYYSCIFLIFRNASSVVSAALPSWRTMCTGCLSCVCKLSENSAVCFVLVATRTHHHLKCTLATPWYRVTARCAFFSEAGWKLGSFGFRSTLGMVIPFRSGLSKWVEWDGCGVRISGAVALSQRPAKSLLD